MAEKCWRCGFMHATGCVCPKCGRGGGNQDSIDMPVKEFAKPMRFVTPVTKAPQYGYHYAI